MVDSEAKGKLKMLAKYYPDMTEGDLIHLALDSLWIKTLEAQYGKVDIGGDIPNPDDFIRETMREWAITDLETIVEQTLQEFAEATK